MQGVFGGSGQRATVPKPTETQSVGREHANVLARKTHMSMKVWSRV
jgi:hypothetical protein